MIECLVPIIIQEADCPDALALAQFYAHVLDWRLEDGSTRDWATLIPPGGGVSPDNPDGRATLHPQQPSKDDNFRVYLDPVGHPYCLIR